MPDLIDYVQDHGLTVTEHNMGAYAVTEGVREGEDNRFELDLLEWDGGVLRAWRDSNPKKLLEDGLALAALSEGGSGFLKMRLFDRRGGHPHGESVTFTTNPLQTELSEVLLRGESPPDELEASLFGEATADSKKLV